MDNEPSAITKEIKDFFDARTKEGVKKYGTTVDREDLTVEQWMTHTIEELADAIQYLWKVRKIMTSATKTTKECYIPIEKSNLTLGNHYYHLNDECEYCQNILIDFVEVGTVTHGLISNGISTKKVVPLNTLYVKQ